ncbi:MAG: Zn-dependent alcohol dehydrogenase [Anaerolineaceae bacterium]|nr:Zn-dependent alcohol dehydrogenase [Anaerolineaceae bacterium]
MEALVKYDSRDHAVEVRDIPEPPSPGPNEVILEVKAAGVCGSDLHMWHENHSWQIKLPLVLGHEFCGVIADVGANVTGFKVGDRVACETAASVCNQCIYCLTGNYNLCPNRQGYGALADGAFTRYVTARPQILHHIPDNVPFAHAALTEPICVAYNALVEKTSSMKPGDTVVIQGPGPIGIMALLVTRLRGASTIIMLGTDRDKHRLDVAAELGAHHVINIQQQDPVEVVRSLGDGFGADLIVDCSGVSAALKQSMELVRPNGTITKIGWGPQPLNFNLDPLVAKAVTLQGTFSHTYSTWERVLGLLSSRQINLDPVIGGEYALNDWEKAFTKMDEGENVKSVLVLN